MKLAERKKRRGCRRSGRRRDRRDLGLERLRGISFLVARTVQQQPFLAIPSILLAHELERIAQRLNRRFDGRLDVPALQFQTIDFPLHVLEARLRLFEQQIRSALRFAYDPLGLSFRVRRDVVRKAASG